ncbi:MAG TPA: amidase family protein [Amycolatopsis sp.]|nr:amidase family protein [Amycolatopsis sp.]
MRTAVTRVREAYRRIAAVHRPDVWSCLRDEREVLAEAGDLPDPELPLAGLVFTVTATGAAGGQGIGAPAVRRLADSGALLLGTTVLEPFLTGLTSPHGPVSHARLRDRVSGGCGSAVAVALGITDFALGTDGACSGLVSGALHGILGLTPTPGLIPGTRPGRGVTVFAPGVAVGRRALTALTAPTESRTGPRTGTPTGSDRTGAAGSAWAAAVRLSAGERPRIAIPDDSGLAPLSTEAKYAFHATAGRLRGFGAIVESVDIAPFLDAARLLTDGALATEVHPRLREFVTAHLDEIDPAIAAAVLASGNLPAHRLVADLERLDRHRADALATLHGFDTLVVPATTEHPALAAAHADPVTVTTRLGTYANCAGLLGLAAVSAPAGTADGSPFGVCVLTQAYEDQVALDVAGLLTGESAASIGPVTGIDLVVTGAGPRGELTRLGARFGGELPTGERWTISESQLGRLLAVLPPGARLGPIRLESGESLLALRC